MPVNRPRRTQDDSDFSGGGTDAGSLLLIGAGAILFLALASYTPDDLPDWVSFSTRVPANNPVHNIIGPFGAMASGYLIFLLGGAAFLLPFSFVWLGLARIFMGMRLLRSGFVPARPLIGFGVFLASGAVFLGVQSVWFQSWWRDYNTFGPGGGLGFIGRRVAESTIGIAGAVILSLTGYVIGLVLMTGIRPRALGITLQRAWGQIMFRLSGRRAALVAQAHEKEAAQLATEQRKTDRERRRLERELKRHESAASATAVHTPLDPAGRLDFAALDEEVLGLPDGDLTPLLPLGGLVPAVPAAVPVVPAVPEPEPEPPIIDGSRRSTPTGERKLSLAEWRKAQQKSRAEESGNSPVSAAQDFSNYVLPPLDILHWDESLGDLKLDERGLRETQRTIVRTLETFGIHVSPGPITRGPTISRYEVYPSEGLSVKKIAAYEADIARATCAERINILAPIPGKDTVGIEIANADKVAVPLRELLEDDTFARTKARLPFALGKDVYGNTIVADLSAMPHLLVAGSTGSGKSVCINSIIGSLLFQFTPAQLRFIMIDPKVVEMQTYNELPHLVVPVVTDPKKVIMALRWVVNEMEHRYRIFATEGVRNFDAFNGRRRVPRPSKAAAAKTKDGLVAGGTGREGTPLLPLFDEPKSAAAAAAAAASGPPADNYLLATGAAAAEVEGDIVFEDPEAEAAEALAVHQVVTDAPRAEIWDDSELVAQDNAEEEDDENTIPDSMPYIVLIIDELADLMQTAPADMEGLIARLAQKARAAGIHMILATQTPRKEVITGVIKANIPCRIAFQVTSGLDSRVILDTQGAEKLVGKGDMLYLPPGTAKMIRAQGAFVTDEEIVNLVKHCRTQAAPAFDRDVQRTMGDGPPEIEDISDEDEETLEKCIEVVMQEKKASTSLLQRRLRLGYGRAARMIDLMENRGIIGPGDGSKPREILIQLDEDEDA